MFTVSILRGDGCFGRRIRSGRLCPFTFINPTDAPCGMLDEYKCGETFTLCNHNYIPNSGSVYKCLLGIYVQDRIQIGEQLGITFFLNFLVAPDFCFGLMFVFSGCLC